MICRLLCLVIMFSGVAKAESSNRIVSFLLTEVEVCDDPDVISSCKEIERSELPDPTVNQIDIINIDKNGMVEIIYRNRSVYIHRTEVLLSKSPSVSASCKEREKETSLNVNVYGMHGAMEQCDE